MRRSWWGWGGEEEALPAGLRAKLGAAIGGRFGTSVEAREAPSLDALDLRPARVGPPTTLAPRCSTDPYDRAGHTYGKAYRDVVRAFHGDVGRPPDLVAFPQDEAD